MCSRTLEDSVSRGGSIIPYRPLIIYVLVLFILPYWAYWPRDGSLVVRYQMFCSADRGLGIPGLHHIVCSQISFDSFFNEDKGPVASHYIFMASQCLRDEFSSYSKLSLTNHNWLGFHPITNKNCCPTFSFCEMFLCRVLHLRDTVLYTVSLPYGTCSSKANQINN